MSDKQSPNTIHAKIGFFQDLLLRAKLVLRLMGDRRVNPLIKLIPIGSLVYLIVPDLIPGPIDDAAVIWLAAYLFVELCPPEVVKEHMDTLYRVIPGEWRDPVVANQPSANTSSEEEIIDGEYKEVDRNKP